MANKTKKATRVTESTTSKKNKPSGATTARATSKHPGLNPKLFSRIKQEFHDIDYAEQLSEKDKDYLSSFMEEKLGARFNHDGKKHHKTKSSKRGIYNENNARQRDTYSLGRATGKMVDIDPEIAVGIWQEKYLNYDFEESMIPEKEVPELLTKREFNKLLKDGAELPFEMMAFYIDYYDIDLE